MFPRFRARILLKVGVTFGVSVLIVQIILTARRFQYNQESLIDDGGNVSVLLLAYQRCGSSFTGGVFHSNRDVYYIYEPLDMVYTAMYGISPGWASPADIFYTKDGQLRELPDAEIDAMLWVLEKIYTCRMSELPTTMLLHPFWGRFSRNMPGVGGYHACLTALGLEHPARGCHSLLRRVCSPRISWRHQNTALCRDVLWNHGLWYTPPNVIKANYTSVKSQEFLHYFRCLDRYRKSAVQCAGKHLDDVCADRRVRVIKTVRAPMLVAERLMSSMRHTRVVHLVRDPRGVTRSRERALWSWGKAEGKTPGAHASRYCPSVVKDYMLLTQLSTTYPGQTMSVVYDQFVKAPMEWTHKIYKCMGVKVENSTIQWLERHMYSKSITGKPKDHEAKVIVKMGNSSNIASSWKRYYNQTHLDEIVSVCREFYRTIPGFSDFLIT